MDVEGHDIRLIRRRYGHNTTFTWIIVDGIETDPVQKINPSKKDVLTTIAIVVGREHDKNQKTA